MIATKRLAPFALLLALAAVGCAKKKPAPPPALPEESLGTDMVPPATPPSQADNAPRIAGDPLSGPLDDVNAYLQQQGLIGDIYFEFDSPQISGEAADRLRKNAAFMKAHPQFVFMIEGHCDERDTIEYNLALGQRRAAATETYLADLNVAKDRLQTISYGKERPVCEGSSEDCWGKNRRAHFLVTERR